MIQIGSLVEFGLSKVLILIEFTCGLAGGSDDVSVMEVAIVILTIQKFTVCLKNIP